MDARPHNLLAVSDLHLGCDLKASGRPGRTLSFDLQLAGFLDYHAAHRKGGKPWRLLLNGDIVDFVAITVVPGPEAGFEVRPEERVFGLAPEEAKCVWKLRKTFERHPEIVDALARFLLKGNSLHIVRGNHDAELHWPAVQAEFRALLAERAGVRDAARRRFEQQIQFHRWFYLEPAFLYAEHGHAHDRYSVQAEFFEPALAREREMPLALSSQVVRYFANRHLEQAVLDQADRWGFRDYTRWVLKASNPLQIASDYFVMVFRVTYPIFRQSVRFWRKVARVADRAMANSNAGDPAARPRRRLRRFSGTEAQARQLLAIVSRPAEQSLFDSIQLFFLDRMLLALLCLIGCAFAVGLLHGAWAKAGAVVAVGIVFAALNAALGRMRNTDTHPLLMQAARRVAQIFDVRYVVMGHSHRAVSEPIGVGARYFNLGSWTGARGEGFPHVVVADGKAELRRWTGPPPEPASIEAEEPAVAPELPSTAS